ncbi:MAG TPA: hypothetical protein VLL48_09375, partial [Longimicrobiales bacterium]|nr:hypothetical protein [Longimicrobiales bacterium]
MPVSNRSVALVGCVLSLGILAILGYPRIRGEEPGSAAVPVDPFPPDLDQPVIGAPVVRGTLTVSVTGTGRAAAHRRAVMKARVGGTVRRV